MLVCASEQQPAQATGIVYPTVERTGPGAAKPVRCCFKAKTGAALSKTPKTVEGSVVDMVIAVATSEFCPFSPSTIYNLEFLRVEVLFGCPDP